MRHYQKSLTLSIVSSLAQIFPLPALITPCLGILRLSVNMFLNKVTPNVPNTLNIFPNKVTPKILIL